MASGKPLDPEIANDKNLRRDFDYDVSRDVDGDGALDIDDEYSELSGVVGRRNPTAFCILLLRIAPWSARMSFGDSNVTSVGIHRHRRRWRRILAIWNRFRVT